MKKNIENAKLAGTKNTRTSVSMEYSNAVRLRIYWKKDSDLTKDPESENMRAGVIIFFANFIRHEVNNTLLWNIKAEFPFPAYTRLLQDNKAPLKSIFSRQSLSGVRLRAF